LKYIALIGCLGLASSIFLFEVPVKAQGTFKFVSSSTSTITDDVSGDRGAVSVFGFTITATGDEEVHLNGVTLSLQPVLTADITSILISRITNEDDSYGSFVIPEGSTRQFDIVSNIQPPEGAAGLYRLVFSSANCDGITIPVGFGSDVFVLQDVPLQDVPEPGTLSLSVIGACGLVAFAKRRGRFKS
jgi:hypothetical protein